MLLPPQFKSNLLSRPLDVPRAPENFGRPPQWQPRLYLDNRRIPACCFLYLPVFCSRSRRCFTNIFTFPHPTCTRFDDQYQYLELVYEMAEAQYDVLAPFLLDSLHSFCLFVSPSLLFRARSLNQFLCLARSPPNGKSLRQKDYASTIHHSTSDKLPANPFFMYIHLIILLLFLMIFPFLLFLVIIYIHLFQC